MSILARLPTGKGWEGAVGRRLLKLSFEQGAIATFLSGSRGAREGTPGGEGEQGERAQRLFLALAREREAGSCEGQK